AVVTPETLRGIAAWPLSIVLLSLCAICVIVATSYYLRVVHGWVPLSALLGASPGGMAQVMAISAELCPNLRGIAIVKQLRVALVTIGLPGGLALFGRTGGSMLVARAPAGGASLAELVALSVIATGLAMFMQWIRFPGGLLFGAMAGSAILHGGDFLHATLPW